MAQNVWTSLVSQMRPSYKPKVSVTFIMQLRNSDKHFAKRTLIFLLLLLLLLTAAAATWRPALSKWRSYVYDFAQQIINLICFVCSRLIVNCHFPLTFCPNFISWSQQNDTPYHAHCEALVALMLLVLRESQLAVLLSLTHTHRHTILSSCYCSGAAGILFLLLPACSGLFWQANIAGHSIQLCTILWSNCWFSLAKNIFF